MNRDLPFAEQRVTGAALTDDVQPDGLPRVPARLVEYARGRHVALPQHTTIELIEAPAVIPVPGAAYYAHGLLPWQGQHLALLDLDRLLLAHARPGALAVPRYALVLAFQRAAGAPIEHGAIGTSALPQTVAVGDDAQCELPTDSDLWPLLALSCFQHGGQAVPILSTARLFAGYHG